MLEETKKLMDHFGIQLKTMSGWDSFAEETGKTSWDDYCRPGDFVYEDVYEHFLNILPPRNLWKGYLQAGEEKGVCRHPSNRKNCGTYMTFAGSGITHVWIYCGDCVAGGDIDVRFYQDYGNIQNFLKKTFYMKFGNMAVRPHIVCKDGFTFSVQASDSHYCYPRANLEDEAYETCEIGCLPYETPCLTPFAEDPKKPLETVYGQVPLALVDEVIQSHGGYFVSPIRYF